MRRLLIITYYWPPSGGAGVQRWLKFAKYLPQYGWQPVIYTPSNPEIPVEDRSLMKDIPSEAEIITTTIWEPYEWYKRFTGKKGQKMNAAFLNEKGKSGLLEKIAIWLRGNLFIPDARKYWVKPSVSFLENYLKQHPVDAVVTSGPPHSMHLIGLELKRRMNLKWVADFRDPWTNIDFYQDLMLSKRADRKHRRMEAAVLKEADAVVAIGKTMAEEFMSMSSRKIDVITNGFDDADMAQGTVVLDKKFTVAHIGTLTKSRNPEMLWKAFADTIKETEGLKNDLKIVLLGKVDFTVKKALEDNGLLEYTDLLEYIPHDEVVKVQQRSQLLLLILNNTPNAKGILTGKMFEYLASGRPVFCIGDTEGDAAEIIAATGSGITCNFDDLQRMKEGIKSYYNIYKGHGLQQDSTGVSRYSRKSLTGELAALIDSIVK